MHILDGFYWRRMIKRRPNQDNPWDNVLKNSAHAGIRARIGDEYDWVNGYRVSWGEIELEAQIWAWMNRKKERHLSLDICLDGPMTKALSEKLLTLPRWTWAAGQKGARHLIYVVPLSASMAAHIDAAPKMTLSGSWVAKLTNDGLAALTAFLAEQLGASNLKPDRRASLL